MDKRINDQIHEYLIKFKDSIKDKIRELGLHEKDKVNDILEFINEYEKLKFDKEDFQSKKRVKNAIPLIHRCNAKRANGEQCTRKRKDGYDFCGTHTKGIPNGSIQIDTNIQTTYKIEVIVQNINGIVYYLDQENNIYRTEDILSNKENPQVVAKYIKNEDGSFHIERFLV